MVVGDQDGRGVIAADEVAASHQEAGADGSAARMSHVGYGAATGHAALIPRVSDHSGAAEDLLEDPLAGLPGVGRFAGQIAPPARRQQHSAIVVEVAVPRLVGQVVDEFIRGLLGPDRVEEQAHGLGPVAGAVLTGGVSAVVHARPVRRPGHGEELRVADDIRQVLARGELPEVPDGMSRPVS